MKNATKLMSVLLAFAMLITVVSVSFSVSAATDTLTSYYATNPDGKVGVQKTITVDGSLSDWDSSMLIAQGTANDDPRVYRDNSMYEVPIDMYALYGAYDDSNLYLMWEMTNVQDVVAPNDDYPLSQGILYQTQNLPFFIAIDTGKSDTIGNSGQLTTGGTIWNSGITIDTAFNRLIAVSTNGSNGPFVYSGSSAGLNPKEISSYSASGIGFNYGLGILSKNVYGIDKAYGKYNKRVVGDMCNENAAWVDFNTKGHKSSTMDFHYEMSIPLSQLGITKSDITSNGVGAMVIATFGKSGMDCLPYDLTMNDNADQADTESQEFNSYEKSDEDNITVAFARIGKNGSTPDPQPVTDPTTPTTPTEPDPDPDPETLTVNATSNLFDTSVLSGLKAGDTVTVKYDLTSAMKVVNGQWKLAYDASKLKLTSSASAMTPVTGGTVNTDINPVKGNFQDVTNLYDFTTGQTLVQAEFEVLDTGSADVNLTVEELSVGYLKNGVVTFENIVEDSQLQDITGKSGFSNASVAGISEVTTDSAPETLIVNADSNFFDSTTSDVFYDMVNKQVTVVYNLQADKKLLNTQWVLRYDSDILQYNSAFMPKTGGYIRNPEAGVVTGSYTNAGLVDVSSKDAFAVFTFDVLDAGVADVNLDVRILGFGEDTGDTEYYLVDKGVVDSAVASQMKYSTGTEVFEGAYSSLLGDVNCDGTVDIKDVTALQRYIAEFSDSALTSRALANADVNKDGKYDIKDVTAIQRMIAGLSY